MGRKAPHTNDTRARILDAALAEFGARGYLAASIDEIAARAGVTKGAVYYWFEDKDDLAHDLQVEVWDRLKHEALVAFDPSGDTIDNLRACFDAYVAALQAMPQARFFLREVWALPRDDSGERADAYGLVRDILAAGMVRGELRDLDAEALARVLVGIYNEATLHVIETGDPGPTAEVVHHLVGSLAPTKARRSR